MLTFPRISFKPLQVGRRRHDEEEEAEDLPQCEWIAYPKVLYNKTVGYMAFCPNLDPDREGYRAV